MNRDEKIAYLKQYENVYYRIVGLENEIEKWESVAQRINQQYTAAPVGSGGSSRVENASVQVASAFSEIQLFLRNKAKEPLELRQAIEYTINHKSPKKRYAELLRMRYIHMMSVEKIADTIHKDIRTTRRALNAAIDELDI